MLAGAQHARVTDAWAFGPALNHAMGHAGFHVLEAVVDPDRDRAQRAQLTDRADAALAQLEA